MYWYLKHFWRFVSGIPSCAKDTWQVSEWSSYSKGRFLDLVEALVMQWNGFLLACFLHWHARRNDKKRIARFRAFKHRTSY